MKLEKLIVDGADALKIKNAVNDRIKLTRVLRGSLKTNAQNHAKNIFKNKTFWVAEPSTIFTNGSERKTLLTGDKRPKGFRQFTCRSSGTRMHYGEHRFLAEVISYEVVGGKSGGVWVEVVFQIKEK